MVAEAGVVGIPIDDIVAAALALPSGSQRAYYCAEVAGWIGPDPNIRILVGSDEAYKDRIPGMLSHSAEGIPLPLSFDEPPEVHTANDLTDPDIILEVTSTTPAGRRIRIPLALSTAEDTTKLAISLELDGTNPVRTTSVTLLPPATLDQTVAGDTGIVASVQGFLDDMLQPADAAAQPKGGQNAGRILAVTRVSSWAAVVHMHAAINGIARGDFPTYWNSIVGWLWLWEAVSNQAVNTGILCHKYECWIRRASSGLWVRAWGPTGFSGHINYAQTGGGNAGNQVVIDSLTTRVQPSAYAAYELWPVPFITPVRSLMEDCAAIHVRALVRLERISPNQPDDRHLARYYAMQGHDPHASGHPNFPARGSNTGGTGNPWTRPQMGNYAGFALDGEISRRKIIPFDPARPDLWYAIGCTSLEGQNLNAGILPPWNRHWNNGSPVTAYSGIWPYSFHPYATRESDFRLNPPPMPT